MQTDPITLAEQLAWEAYAKLHGWCVHPTNDGIAIKGAYLAGRADCSVAVNAELLAVVQWIGDIMIGAKDGGNLWCAMRDRPDASKWFDDMKAALANAKHLHPSDESKAPANDTGHRVLGVNQPMGEGDLQP